MNEPPGTKKPGDVSTPLADRCLTMQTEHTLDITSVYHESICRVNVCTELGRR